MRRQLLWAWRCSWAAIFGLAALTSQGAADRTGQEQPTAAEEARVFRIAFQNPLNETVFPPEMPPPVFQWADNESVSGAWRVEVGFADHPDRIESVVHASSWTPALEAWSKIKRLAVDWPTTVTVTGFKADLTGRPLSRGSVRISVSKDAVAASLFYREVNLPFAEAVKDPSKIRWRFGPVSSMEPPRIVLEHLPVCGNCHSFSANGQVMGMDVDYANSKGSYVITRTGPQMALSPKDIITWDDYRKEDGELTFGLLSQVSPDGRRVVSTVKDKSVFVPRPDLAFSQLFFPIKGILVVYDRESRTFAPLPGADDPAYVQSNPTWSPDGRYIVFARTKAYNLSNTAGQGKVLLTPEECREFTRDGRPFRFDLYRVPYNDGRGGHAEPLEGASGDDQSHYFARYSPDGKWIVFCRAANYMLLQPDSELYIIPSDGGKARRLRANTRRMNSWHSWSPNSRWLVFSSKANSPYTQLCLTHIDDQGESTPPVFLTRFSAPDRAANIPEFVNLPPEGIVKINDHFLNDYSFERAGNEFYRAGDPDHAIEKFRETLALNSENITAHQRLGFLLYNVRHQFEEGLAHTREALRLDPGNGFAHSDLAIALLNQGKPEPALDHFDAALKAPKLTTEGQYKPEAIHVSAAQACLQLGRQSEAEAHLKEAIRLNAADADARYLLALVCVLQSRLDDALTCYQKAVALRPGVDTSATLHDLFSVAYANAGRMAEAVQSGERALTMAEKAGKTEMAERIRIRLARYKGGSNVVQPGPGSR